MGAVVRAFDTRIAAREQIQSLGGEFLTVELEEDGSGSGGYAKEMSKEYHDAEMALFKKQAEEVDIVITTALIPGKPAPKLLTREFVETLKPGSVIVDLAAEAGGNCEMTQPGKAVQHNGVTIIGYSDLPSRLPTQSSTLYSNNVTKFLLSMTPPTGDKNAFAVNLEDEVVRRSIITHDGATLWPAPAPPAPAPAAKPAVSQQSGPTAAAAAKEVTALTPWQQATRQVGAVTLGTGALLAAGFASGPPFVANLTVLSLASVIGYVSIWSVQPALHSPLSQSRSSHCPKPGLQEHQ